MVEENNSTVLREERNRNWDNGIRRRPNICPTNTRVIAKTKVTPGNNTYLGILREVRTNLMVADSHIERVKKTTKLVR